MYAPLFGLVVFTVSGVFLSSKLKSLSMASVLRSAHDLQPHGRSEEDHGKLQQKGSLSSVATQLSKERLLLKPEFLLLPLLFPAF